jgi:hypothetical protein
MPRVEFEPTTPVLEWAKMIHALDPTTAVIGRPTIRRYVISDTDSVIK